MVCNRMAHVVWQMLCYQKMGNQERGMNMDDNDLAMLEMKLKEWPYMFSYRSPVCQCDSCRFLGGDKADSSVGLQESPGCFHDLTDNMTMEEYHAFFNKGWLENNCEHYEPKE